MNLITKVKTLTLFSLLILSVFVTSCKDKDKDDAPTADLTAEAVGKYVATKITYEGKEENVTGYGFSVEVIKVKENLVTLKLNTGVDTEIADVPLKGKSGAITFSKKDGDDTFEGTISGTKINLSVNGTEMILEGERYTGDGEIVPDLALVGAGKYNVTKMSYNGFEEDLSGDGNTIEVIRVRENLITLKLSIGEDLDIPDVALTGNRNAIAFTKKEDGDTMVGTISGDKITLTLNSSDSSIIFIEGQK